MSDRFRNFCFTQHDVSTMDTLLAYPCSYIVIGVEKAPSTGTVHLQGYCELGKQERFTALSKIFGHIEKRRGTAQQAADYCKKDGIFKEAGEISNQGKRSDLEEVVNDVTMGFPIDKIAMNNPIAFIKYNRGIKELIGLRQEHRKVRPTVEWVWGLAGVGKTYYATSKHASRYIKDGTMWWDGYKQEEAIIIDDFDGKWPFRDLLRLIDRYEYQGQYKGGYVKINSPYIYITCEFPPAKYWRANELAQIARRLDRVIELKSPVSEVVGNTSPQLEEEIM